MEAQPIGQSAFEKSLVMKEKMERERAHLVYTLGIQGRDGGYCVTPLNKDNSYAPNKKK